MLERSLNYWILSLTALSRYSLNFVLVRWPYLWKVNPVESKSAMVLPNSFLGHCIGFIYLFVSRSRSTFSILVRSSLSPFRVHILSFELFKSIKEVCAIPFNLSVTSHNFTTWNSVTFLTCIFLLGQCYRRFGFSEGWSNGRHCCCLGISQCSSCFTQGHRKIRFGNYFLMNYVLYLG